MLCKACIFSSLITLLIAPLIPPSPALAESCVQNGSADSLLFAVTAPDRPRLLAQLAPGNSLCSPTQQGATLSVYQDAQAFEGCSRLVGPNQSDSLLAYAEFDRCHWASHDAPAQKASRAP